MSRINVFTSCGQWSKTICGLDKVHLMRRAIKYEYVKTGYWEKKTERESDLDLSGLPDDYPLEFLRDDNYILSGLEIDLKTINANFMDGVSGLKYRSKDYIDWHLFKEVTKIDLSKVQLFKMRLCTLQQMAEKDILASAMYKALIEAALIPSPTPDNYCLMFCFGNE